MDSKPEVKVKDELLALQALIDRSVRKDS
jgi:hypothetical protein